MYVFVVECDIKNYICLWLVEFQTLWRSLRHDRLSRYVPGLLSSNIYVIVEEARALLIGPLDDTLPA